MAILALILASLSFGADIRLGQTVAASTAMRFNVTGSTVIVQCLNAAGTALESCAGSGSSGGGIQSVFVSSGIISTGTITAYLPSSQLTTLTPPPAITGFALEAGNLATLAAKDYATSASQALQATAELQTSGNASLTSIDSKHPAVSSNTFGVVAAPVVDMDSVSLLQQILIQLQNLNSHEFFIRAALSPSSIPPQ